MSNYKVTNKVGEYHVWTKNNSWVAWFRTNEQATEFIKQADSYEHEPFIHPDNK